jgi:hypothetical protein
MVVNTGLPEGFLLPKGTGMTSEQLPIFNLTVHSATSHLRQGLGISIPLHRYF